MNSIPIPTSPAELINELNNLQLSLYMVVAGSVLFAYDWALTFADEVQLIWKGRMNTVKVLYLWNRITLPLVIAIDLYDKGGMAPVLTPKICQAALFVDGWMTVASYACIHWIVALRVWTLYGRSKRLLAVFIALFALYLIASCILWGWAAVDISHVIQPNPIAIHVCITTVPSWLWTIWLPALAFECLIFAMTLFKAWQHWMNSVNTPVLSVLYRDGFAYFFVISGSCIYNLLVWLVAPPSLVLLAKYFTLSVVNVAVFRLVLDLRAVGVELRLRPVDPGPNSHSGGSAMASPSATGPHSYEVPLRLLTNQMGNKMEYGTGTSPMNSPRAAYAPFGAHSEDRKPVSAKRSFGDLETMKFARPATPHGLPDGAFVVPDSSIPSPFRSPSHPNQPLHFHLPRNLAMSRTSIRSISPVQDQSGHPPPYSSDRTDFLSLSRGTIGQEVSESDTSFFSTSQVAFSRSASEALAYYPPIQREQSRTSRATQGDEENYVEQIAAEWRWTGMDDSAAPAVSAPVPPSNMSLGTPLNTPLNGRFPRSAMASEYHRIDPQNSEYPPPPAVPRRGGFPRSRSQPQLRGRESDGEFVFPLGR